MNVREVEVTDELTGEITTHVIVDHGNNQFTSMSKAHYDELEAQREQSGTL